MAAPTISRSSVVRGAGTVTLNTTPIFDKGNINAEMILETFDVPVAGFGAIDKRIRDGMGRISFTPAGQASAGILGVLYPYANPTIGGSIFGASDVPCIVHSINGVKITFHASAVTRMPNLKLSAENTLFGAAEVTALTKNNTARDTANSMYTRASEAWSGSIVPGDIKTVAYTGAWGSALTGILSAEGWDIEFDVGLAPQRFDGAGTYDMLLTSVTARAKCRPVNLSEAVIDSMLLQGTGAAVGAAAGAANNLVITGTGGLTVTLYGASFNRGPLVWGDGELRAGEIGFEAVRSISNGTPGAVFAVAMTA